MPGSVSLTKTRKGPKVSNPWCGATNQSGALVADECREGCAGERDAAGPARRRGRRPFMKFEIWF
jgi:hypothetical protein